MGLALSVSTDMAMRRPLVRGTGNRLAPRSYFCIACEHKQSLHWSRLNISEFIYSLPMKIITNNPYRVLGVFSNSPMKERVANVSKIKAFLKVNKSVSFPNDIDGLLPNVIRTTETILQAEQSLALPIDQLHYAQFWFVRATPLDDVAFNHLQSGNIDKANEIWAKRDCASSLQNRMIVALIQKRYHLAVDCAEKLYSQYKEVIAYSILGEIKNVKADVNSSFFIDCLIEEIPLDILNTSVNNTAWRKYIVDKSVGPIIEEIGHAISIAQESRTNGPNARLQAGLTLKEKTMPAINSLKSFLADTDIRLQTIADRLGMEILECSIDYYNKSSDWDAARQASVLARYASAVVVGQMAKDICADNLRTIEEYVAELPPESVQKEYQAIQDEISRFVALPDKISYAVELLNTTKHYFYLLKINLGSDNKFYIKLSTQVVSNALNNVIAEVNAMLNNGEDGYMADISLKSTLADAWNAMQLMGTFTMELGFLGGRYAENRKTLKEMCEELHIRTDLPYSPRHSSSNSKTQTTRPQQPQKPVATSTSHSSPTKPSHSETATSSSAPTEETESEEHNYTGCVIVVIVILFLFFALKLCSGSSGSSDYSSSSYSNPSYSSTSDDSKSDDDSYAASNSKAYNRLSTGTSPYKGRNSGMGSNSQIKVTTSSSGSNDVVVILKRNGRIARNVYIRGGDSYTLDVKRGEYQVFFYSGSDWNSMKKMPDGSVGGFLYDENVIKDDPIYLNHNILTYTLELSRNGNFSAQPSSVDEAF